ncbi:MAG: hypothetical protein V7629_13840 [Motiliproteus sp.]
MLNVKGGYLFLLLFTAPAWCETTADLDSIDLNQMGNPVTTGELDRQRGREGFDFQFNANLNDQDAKVTDNQISVGSTGGNIISDQAFTDTTGNVTVIQNSGNGVAIQSSTLINLSITY